MLKNIKFSTVIVNDGTPVFTVKDFEHSFATGLTAITGKNGSGKSMIPEMIGYALFGSKAVRGKAEDYKTLDVSLDAVINGKNIRVERVKNNAKLLVDGADAASGTSAVNKAISELFGYSFDVFNVANAAKQGEIEKLGAMKPADRKRLVDETVGVDALDALETYIAGEAKSARAVADALGDIAEPPTTPILEAKLTREETEAKLQELRADQLEKSKLSDICGRKIGDKPTEPAAPDIAESIETLREMETNRDRVIGVLDSLKTQQNILCIAPGTNQVKPVEPAVPANLQDEEILREKATKASELRGRIGAKQDEATRLAKLVGGLDYAIDDITAAYDAVTAYDENRRQIALRNELRETKVPQICPACDHHYENADPRLFELEKLAKLPVPAFTNEQITRYEASEITKKNIADLNDERDMFALELKKLGDPQAALTEIDAYHRAAAEYTRLNAAYAKYAEYDELQAKIDAVVIPNSVKDKIEQLHAFELTHTAWQKDIGAWRRQHDEIVEAEAKLFTAKYSVDFDAEIQTYTHERDLHIRHEQELKAYAQTLEAVTLSNAKIAAVATEIDQWKRCREAVRILRAKVKGFLLPSLNRAASHLLSEMTNGQFSAITVSDEFEITVDGQRLETLSGGGKAVANLALRLALGQVLTNRVFSVVMLDEIDASCDDERAASMAAAVRNLSDRDIIRQILLISHKPGIDADHFIRMEEFSSEKAMEVAA